MSNHISNPFDTPSDALAHYGVLGMKWGVRKDRGGSGKSKSATTKKKMSKAQKSDLKKLAVYTAVGAAATIALPLLIEDAFVTDSTLSRGKSAVQGIFKKGVIKAPVKQVRSNSTYFQEAASSIKKSVPNQPNTDKLKSQLADFDRKLAAFDKILKEATAEQIASSKKFFNDLGEYPTYKFPDTNANKLATAKGNDFKKVWDETKRFNL